jgi:hypothetical protein
MSETIIPRCNECKTRVSHYVEKNTKNYTYCKNEKCHKGRIYTKSRHYCITPDCNEFSAYVEKNTENKTYCENKLCHKGQTYLKDKIYCITTDCHEIAKYVEKNTKNKTYCENELCHKGRTYKNGTNYCTIDNCNNNAKCCEKNGNKSIYCDQHVVEKCGFKFKTIITYCRFEGCNKQATFGHEIEIINDDIIENKFIKMSCKDHCCDPNDPSKQIYFDGAHSKCKECNENRATHGIFIDDEHQPITHCGTCNKKLNLGLIDLTCMKCKIKSINSELTCLARANYGDSADGKLLLCASHVKDAHAKTGKNYIYLSGRKCKFETRGVRCVTQPTYGIPGTETPLFCLEHRDLKIHVNVVSKICEHPNCLTRPSFGIHGGPAIFCESHKDAEIHINVVSARCTHIGCDNFATYAEINTAKAILCKLHKEDVESYNIKDKYHIRCTEPECNKMAIFGNPDDGIAVFCSFHKFLHGMDKFIDVQNKKCTEIGCEIAPWYGYLGITPRKCARHHTSGMIPKPIKRCIRCQKTASHVKNQEFYCTKCKDADAQDFRFSCSICYSTLKDDKPVCDSCIEFLKTNKTVKRQQKELKIKAYLEQNNVIIKSYDRAIGESRKRPDFIIERPNGNIIIECDEYQHLGNKADYTCRCEILRMNQIYFDLFDTTSVSENKVLFIRFNPDEYESDDTRATMDERLGQLYNLISTFDFDDLDGYLGIKYLFYDQHADNANIDIINPYIEI